MLMIEGEAKPARKLSHFEIQSSKLSIICRRQSIHDQIGPGTNRQETYPDQFTQSPTQLVTLHDCPAMFPNNDCSSTVGTS